MLCDDGGFLAPPRYYLSLASTRQEQFEWSVEMYGARCTVNRTLLTVTGTLFSFDALVSKDRQHKVSGFDPRILEFTGTTAPILSTIKRRSSRKGTDAR